MSDRREEILKSEFDSEDFYADVKLAVQDGFDLDKLKNAMDEYMKETCLQLLEYMLKKDAVPCVMTDGLGHEMAGFSIGRGKFVTKEQLFENFL